MDKKRMALERIDPFAREDRYSVDHILRYAWAGTAARNKRVLDAACGTGFGTTLLAHSGAAWVTGVDRCEQTVARCREEWPLTNAEFLVASIETLREIDRKPFDVAVTFETLEHVADPERALHALKAALMPCGVVIGSVPGETEANDFNEFHLHRFQRKSLETLLRNVFRGVKIYRQRFRLCSEIDTGESNEVVPMRWGSRRVLHLDFGHADGVTDSYLFVASDNSLPSLPSDAAAWSREAWLAAEHFTSTAVGGLDQLHRKLGDINTEYRRLFAEKGDLQRRFKNVLEWGKFHYEQLHGRKSERHYLQAIEEAQSKREEHLRRRVDEIQYDLSQAEKEINNLKAMLRQAEEASFQFARSRKQSFEKGLASPRDAKP